MRNFILLACFFSASSWACLEPPLPTSPSGPTWTEVYERRLSSGTITESAEVTAWRYQCPTGEPLLLMTFEPLLGSPFTCSTSFDVIQSSVQYSNLLLATDPSTTSSGFCNDVLVKSTFAVLQRGSGPRWDDTGSFQLAWRSDVFLEVGAYRPSDYDDENGSVPLHGSLSGSWFDPERDGEGLILEFSENPSGYVAVLFWFTHRDGVPYWLLGSTAYELGQADLTFDLLEFSGTGFGSDFNADQLNVADIGAISLEFDTCSTGVASWETKEGESGSFNLERITAGLHGVACE